MFGYSVVGLEEFIGAIFLVLLPIILIAIGIIVIYYVGLWKLFKKAGKQGWEAIIPYYNLWVYVEIAGLNWWWFLIVAASSIVSLIGIDSLSGLASLVSFLGLFVCNYNISKKLNKDTTFAILLTIFSPIMLLIIGISEKYVWNKDIPVSNNGPFNSSQNPQQNNNTTNTNSNINYDSDNNNNYKYCQYCGNKMNNTDKYCNNCGKEN